MKISKVVVPDITLQVPDECYMRGEDALFHVQTAKRPMVVNLPSIAKETRMRWGWCMFIFDSERNAEKNNITIRAVGDDRINGVTELVLKANGICVMIQPVGINDWVCFIPVMPDAGKSRTVAPVAGKKSEPDNKASKNGKEATVEEPAESGTGEGGK